MIKTLIAVLSIACMAGCGTLGGPDIERKLIDAATKCVADAATILVAQREAAVVDSAAAQMVMLQREANAKQCPDAPPAAAATPLQSRKP